MPRMISMDLQECRVLHMKQDGPKGPKVRCLGPLGDREVIVKSPEAHGRPGWTWMATCPSLME